MPITRLPAATSDYVVCTSTTRPTVREGLIIYETDTDLQYIGWGSTPAWDRYDYAHSESVFVGGPGASSTTDVDATLPGPVGLTFVKRATRTKLHFAVDASGLYHTTDVTNLALSVYVAGVPVTAPTGVQLLQATPAEDGRFGINSTCSDVLAAGSLAVALRWRRITPSGTLYQSGVGQTSLTVSEVIVT